MLNLIKISMNNHSIFKNRKYNVENTTYFLNHDFLSETHQITMFSDLKPLAQPNTYKVNENTWEMGTISAILKLKEEGVKGNIIALNFASALSPGGGYLFGAKAQEECLCRCSLLYPALLTQKDFYLKHWLLYTPYYHNKMIYSTHVPIIRNEEYQLIEPEFASFLTVAAVNRYSAKCLLQSDEKIEKVMKARMRDIISVLLEQKPEAIVLGAWGCGAFGNDRHMVLNYFETLIQEYVPIDEIKVVFAICEAK